MQRPPAACPLYWAGTLRERIGMRFFLSRNPILSRLFLLLLVPTLGACQPAASSDPAAFAVDYEKYTLENGLDVVLHVDRSDPIVAVAVTYHVGSARERPGKTGFAHLLWTFRATNCRTVSGWSTT